MVEYGYPFWSGKMGAGGRPFYAYYSNQEMLDSVIIKPDGSMQLTPKDSRVYEGSRQFIARPILNVNGDNDVILSNGSGVLSGNGEITITKPSTEELKNMVGMTINLSPNTLSPNNEVSQITFGAPISINELPRGYKPVKIKGSNTLFAGIETTVAIVVVVCVLATIAAIAIALAYWGTSDERKMEIEAEVRKKALETAQLAAKIQSDTTDANGNRIIVFGDGSMVKVDKDGNVTEVKKGIIDPQALANTAMTEPYATEWIQQVVTWGVIGAIAVVGIYAVIVALKKPKYESSPPPTPPPQ